MRYRFFMRDIIETPLFPERDLDVFEPQRSKWVTGWEWRYDFPEIKKNLLLDFKCLIFRLASRLVTVSGGKIQKAQPNIMTEVRYVDIDTDKLSRIILNKLTEIERVRLTRQDSLILIGQKEMYDLRTDETIRFNMQFKMGYRREIRLFETPVIVLPDFDGIAIVPDFRNDG